MSDLILRPAEGHWQEGRQNKLVMEDTHPEPWVGEGASLPLKVRLMLFCSFLHGPSFIQMVLAVTMLGAE